MSARKGEQLARLLANHPLIDRYERLQALKKRIDTELFAVERGLRVAGILAEHGRPRVAPTHSVSQARSAHAAWQRGDRDQWTVDGERQYQREKKRASRAAKAEQQKRQGSAA